MKVGIDSLESNTRGILSNLIGKYITGIRLLKSAEPKRFSDKLMIQLTSGKRKNQNIKQDEVKLFDDKAIFLEICFEKFGTDLEGSSIIATNLSVSSYFFNRPYGIDETVIGFDPDMTNNFRNAILGYQVQDIFLHEGFTPKIMISFDPSGTIGFEIECDNSWLLSISLDFIP